jgi:hypothetical protein
VEANVVGETCLRTKTRLGWKGARLALVEEDSMIIGV